MPAHTGEILPHNIVLHYCAPRDPHSLYMGYPLYNEGQLPL